MSTFEKNRTKTIEKASLREKIAINHDILSTDPIHFDAFVCYIPWEITQLVTFLLTRWDLGCVFIENCKVKKVVIYK